MRLDVATVLRATESRVLRVRHGRIEEDGLGPIDLERAFDEVVIDSRVPLTNALFVAIKGEHVDGHAFVGAAFSAGARGSLVSHVPDGIAESTSVVDGMQPHYLFVTADPTRALQRVAEYWRSQHRADVVGITGSIGKTTTKEILSSVLQSKFSVLRSPANLNTEIGLPLALLTLTRQHEVAVLEMGMYVPGDIAVLADIARPRVGIVTNVAPIHLERAGSIERIARGKSELISHLPPNGLAVLNGDDPWTRAMATTSGDCRAVLFGLSAACDYRAVDVEVHGLDGVSFTLLAEGERLAVRTSVPGAHTVLGFLAAAAVGRELGMSWEEIRHAIAATRVEIRQRVVPVGQAMIIIDDSYNAAPMSVCAALDLLQESPGTKIAVLGDMLELGPEEETAHRKVGERAAEVADWLIVRGSRSAWIAEEAERRGFPAGRVRKVANNSAASLAVREIVGESVKTGSPAPRCEWSVLVKGSRGMKMEEVVRALQMRNGDD